MICKKCGSKFDTLCGKYSTGEFCSKSCANSRKFSDEVKEKMSKSALRYLHREEKLICRCAGCGKQIRKKVFGLCRMCYKKSAECKRVVSERISKAVKGKTGGYRQGAGYKNHQWYESEIAGRVYLDSTWELKYAQWLDTNNVNWKKNTKRFDYVDENGANRYWVPDFYLVDSDEYHEVKGFIQEKDRCKWKHFNPKLRVLLREDLKNIGLDITN